jgi:hypothetical protein
LPRKIVMTAAASRPSQSGNRALEFSASCSDDWSVFLVTGSE